jgi:hypothetical protein
MRTGAITTGAIKEEAIKGEAIKGDAITVGAKAARSRVRLAMFGVGCAVLAMLLCGRLDHESALGDDHVTSGSVGPPSKPVDGLIWQSDYRTAMRHAEQSAQYAVICFVDSPSQKWRDLLREAWAGESVSAETRALHRFVELPTDALLPENKLLPESKETAAETPVQRPAGSPEGLSSSSVDTAQGASNLSTGLSERGSDEVLSQRLMAHPAFADLHERPGVAVIDMRDKTSRHFHRVVSILPFTESTTVGELRELLRLPTGSLSQRTLILAVRTHPDSPESARHAFTPLLADECESHAEYQAELGVQGHHDWETRFHRIAGRLGDGQVPQEVCAESWPGQTLWDAAKECVSSWRQSPGHWNAVRTPHPVFGFDMKRGRNGVWYSVGIFGTAAGSP